MALNRPVHYLKIKYPTFVLMKMRLYLYSHLLVFIIVLHCTPYAYHIVSWRPHCISIGLRVFVAYAMCLHSLHAKIVNVYKHLLVLDLDQSLALCFPRCAMEW